VKSRGSVAATGWTGKDTEGEAKNPMCLLCEELWMPFSFAPEPSAAKFVADAPDDNAAKAAAQSPPDAPDIPQGSSDSSKS
jgi:hypothetical protein